MGRLPGGKNRPRVLSPREQELKDKLIAERERKQNRKESRTQKEANARKIRVQARLDARQQAMEAQLETLKLSAAEVEPLKTANKPVLDENGQPTEFTMPTAEMTLTSYNREMAQQGRAQMFTRLLKSMPIEDLKFALAHHNTPKALAFLGSIVDPRNMNVDIAQMAMIHKIGLGELMQIWRCDRLTVALGEIFSGAPAVARDTVEDAKTIEVCCPRCDGGGQIQVQRKKGPVWIQCVNCKGKGTIRQVGDARSREHVLKATGLVKSDQNFSVVINNQPSGPESVIDELDQLGSRSARIVDLDN